MSRRIACFRSRAVSASGAGRLLAGRGGGGACSRVGGGLSLVSFVMRVSLSGHGAVQGSGGCVLHVPRFTDTDGRDLDVVVQGLLADADGPAPSTHPKVDDPGLAAQQVDRRSRNREAFGDLF